MNFFRTVFETIQGIDWNDPKISLILSLLAVLAVLRKWRLVMMMVLLIAFGKGLRYFLVTEGILEDRVSQVCMIFYLLGGIFIFVVAVVEFFIGEK